MSDTQHSNLKSPTFVEVQRNVLEVVVNLLRMDFELSELADALPGFSTMKVDEREIFSVEFNLRGAISAAQHDGLRTAADCLLSALRASPEGLQTDRYKDDLEFF